ncbi:MAG: pyridoxamine kinase [Lachnospiraceae bacterium]|nr:pyridoxamine kinase [Lachnospiraceae bacterium]
MKRVALINDLSGFGKCSLAAAIPVISVMGLQACPLPTAILSAQTGFDSYFLDDYTDKMNRITDEWSRMDVTFDGIFSGYLAGERQIENVLYFLSHFYTPQTIYLADPVMGDNGRCMKAFSQELLQSMKELTKQADVITPNLTELCLLSGVDYETLVSHSGEGDYASRIAEVAQKLAAQASRPQTVITTGIVFRRGETEHIGNLLVLPSDTRFYDKPYNGKSFSGTGDLFASVVIGSLVRGDSAQIAVSRATEFLQPAIEEASAKKIPRDHGIEFEKYLKNIAV